MPFASEAHGTPSGVKSKNPKITTLSHERKLGVTKSSSEPKFPRIEDCTHFHYDNVYYDDIKVAFADDSQDGLRINGSLSIEGLKPTFSVRITCKGNSWVVRRNLTHFELLDKWLHECVFDRKFSTLPVLQGQLLERKTLKDIQQVLRSYLSKLSSITEKEISGGQISCAPVLHWLETDNHGRNLVPHALGDVADINIPAVAAARVVRRYQAHDEDELSLEVGDMVSIIEMGATGWWRGKQGLKVGSFPSQCVRRINCATDVIGTHERTFSPPSYGAQMKPIARKHGKFMDFLRSFLDTRPSKAQLRRKGILRERVFGCDIGELLHKTGEDVPSVVLDCTKFVERHGVVDGIYRISGVASHIRYLRYEFDSDRRPDLEKEIVGLPNVGRVPGMSKDGHLICDPHSVAGLCKLYFRELPNPLLTYQLYNRFAGAVTDYEAEERLLKVHDVIQQLPPPHYRTLKHLIMHLRFMAQQDDQTSMHCRNLAIVWAPNLLRSRELEAGLAAFTEARVQSVVTEFLIANGDILFSDQLQNIQYDAEHKPPRPRSLMMMPLTQLISLEEAQARSKSGIVTPVTSENQVTPFCTDPGISTTPQQHDVSDASKPSSYERRKRHNKKAGGNIGLPEVTPVKSTTRPSKVVVMRRPGHRPAPNSIDMSSNPAHGPREAWSENKSAQSSVHSSQGSGWKTKLGSLWKKGPNVNENQPSLSRKSSLRRTQSDDSLISSHGPEQKLANSERSKEFPNLPLTHALSCEEPGLSDRSHPEPQVPHIIPSNIAHVARRRRKSQEFSASRSSNARHSRPTGGIYTDDDLQISPNERFQIKYKPVKPKAVDPVRNTLSDVGRRSSSPFLGLASDFPGVMGESGLDFDPLSYKPSNKQEKRSSRKSSNIRSSQIKEMPDETLASNQANFYQDASAKTSQTHEVSPRTKQNYTVSVKRVASIQSLHGEPMFAAVSIPKYRPSLSSQEFVETCDASEEVTVTENEPKPTTYLDNITAEAIRSSTPTPKSCDKLLSSDTALTRLKVNSAEVIRNKLNSTSEEVNNTKTSFGIPKTQQVINNKLDELTADHITELLQPSYTSVVRRKRRISAVEKLGLWRKPSRSSLQSAPIVPDPIKESVKNDDECYSKQDAGEASAVLQEEDEKVVEYEVDENTTTSHKNCGHDVNSNSSVSSNILETSGDSVFENDEQTKSKTKVNVHCYALQEQVGMKKGSHYGSFIALVGLNLENSSECGENANMRTDISPTVQQPVIESETRPKDDRLQDVRHGDCKRDEKSNIEQSSLSKSRDSKGGYLDNNAFTAHDTTEINRCKHPGHGKLNSSSKRYPVHQFVATSHRDDIPLNRRLSGHSFIVSSKLDTFNPEGRRRVDYCPDHTSPDYQLSYEAQYSTGQEFERHSSNALHNRSRSEGSSRHYDSYDESHCNMQPYAYGETRQSNYRKHDSRDVINQDNNDYPYPTPRIHGRSFSAGDSLEHAPMFVPPSEQDRPTPLPRSSVSSQLPESQPIPRRRVSIRHNTGSNVIFNRNNSPNLNQQRTSLPAEACSSNQHSAGPENCHLDRQRARLESGATVISYNNVTYETWLDIHSHGSPYVTSNADHFPSSQSNEAASKFARQHCPKYDQEGGTLPPAVANPIIPECDPYVSNYKPRPVPRNRSSSFVEGPSYNNLSYVDQGLYHDRRSAPCEYLLHEPYGGPDMAHSSVRSTPTIIHSSTALSWV